MSHDQDQTTLEDAEVNASDKAAQTPEAEVVTPPATEAPAQPEAPKSVLTDEDKREMNLAVRTVETSVLSPVMYSQSKLVAKDFFDSGALPKHIQNETQAFVVIVTGAEMAMRPMEALQGLYIINGMINLWGKAVPRQLKKHGFKHKFTDEDQEHCTVVIWKGKSFAGPADDDEQYTGTFKFKDAQDSGYTTANGQLKVGWKPGQNRKLKMRYNVLAEVIKTYIPEVLGEATDVAEVAADFIEGEVADDPKTRTQNGIKAALNARKENGQGVGKSAPAPVHQDQGEDKAE